MVFDGVEHVNDVGAVGGHQGGANDGAPVQVVEVHLGDGNAEALVDVGKHGAQHGPLFLQRMNVPEQKIKFNPANPHASIVLPETPCCQRNAPSQGWILPAIPADGPMLVP